MSSACLLQWQGWEIHKKCWKSLLFDIFGPCWPPSPLFNIHFNISFVELEKLYVYMVISNLIRMSSWVAEARNDEKCWKSLFFISFSLLWPSPPYFCIHFNINFVELKTLYRYMLILNVIRMCPCVAEARMHKQWWKSLFFDSFSLLWPSPPYFCIHFNISFVEL